MSDLFLTAGTHLELFLLQHGDQGISKFTPVLFPGPVSLPGLSSSPSTSQAVPTMEWSHVSLLCAGL